MLSYSSRPDKSFHRFVLLGAVIIYCITAFNSHGYYHADEHYQIVEFAGLKLGSHSPHELAWEYDRGMRSSIQPSICFIVITILKNINITDPYDQMTIIRIISALLSIIIITFFINSAKKFIRDEDIKLFILISYFTWFFPFINVRFSSESWAGLSFLAAMSFLFSGHFREPVKFSMAGLFLGLSFLFRFQMAFLFFGLTFWLLFIQKVKPGNFLRLVISAFIVLMIGVLIDSWFYNKFILTFINYFYIYFIESDVSNFGASPWYYYFYYIIKLPGWPFGILILLSVIFLILRKPKDVILCCIIPFILIHSFIQHKEERFLFPLINLIPLIFVTSLEHFKETRLFYHLKGKKLAKYIFTAIITALILINITGIVAMAFKSAGTGRMEISKFIHDKYYGKPVQLLYFPWSSPYNPWQSLPSKFYSEKNIKEIRINSISDLNDSLINHSKVNLLVIRNAGINDDNCRKSLASFGYIEEKQSIPSWVLYINKYYQGIEEENVLLLFSLNRK